MVTGVDARDFHCYKQLCDVVALEGERALAVRPRRAAAGVVVRQVRRRALDLLAAVAVGAVGVDVAAARAKIPLAL